MVKQPSDNVAKLRKQNGHFPVACAHFSDDDDCCSKELEDQVVEEDSENWVINFDSAVHHPNGNGKYRRRNKLWQKNESVNVRGV